MFVSIEETTISGELKVRIPINRGTMGNADESTEPYGHAIEMREGIPSSQVLSGQLKLLPKRGQKILMHLSFQGTQGFRCLAWTPKPLAEALAEVAKWTRDSVTSKEVKWASAGQD